MFKIPKMEMNRRVVIGSIAGSVILLASTPYLCGVLAQKQFNSIISALSSQPGVSLKVVEYKRGFLSSDAKIDVSLVTSPSHPTPTDNSLPPALPKTFNFSISEHIKHGPLMHDEKGFAIGRALVKNNFVFGPEFQSQVNTIFAGDVKLDIHNDILIRLLGGSSLRLGIGPFRFTRRQDNLTFEVKGLMAQADYTRDMRHKGTEFNCDGLIISGPAQNGEPMVISLGEFGTQIIYKNKSFNSIPTIKTTLSFPELMVKQNDKLVISSSPASVTAETKLKRDLLNFDLFAMLDKLQIQDRQYGPATLKLTFTHLSAKALDILNQQMGEVKSDYSDTQSQAMVFLTLLPETLAVFSEEPTLSLDTLYAKFPEGEIKAQGNLTLKKGPMDLSAITRLVGQFSFQMPKVIFEKVAGDDLADALLSEQAKIRMQIEQGKKDGSMTPVDIKTLEAKLMDPNVIKENAHKMAKARIDTLVSQGMIILENNHYIIRVELDNGKMQINGKTVSL